MNTSKVIVLVKSLSAAEKRKFKHLLQSHKKHSLQNKLFDIINRREEEELTKEFVYKKLYHKEYTKEKDYLLRNDYRKLSKKIEEFLIEEQFQMEIHQNLNLKSYYLLKSMQDLKLYNLFDLNYDNAIHQALSDFDYYTASSITGLQVNNYIHHLTPTENNYQNAELKLNLQMTYLSAFYLNSINEAKINKEYVNQTKNPADSVESTEHTESENAVENSFGGYLKLKLKLFSQHAENKIEICETALNYLDKLDSKHSKIIEEKTFCKSVLAHEYAVNKQYVLSNDIYEEIVLHDSITDDKVAMSIVMDYTSNLIRLKEYSKALEMLNLIKSKIPNHSDALDSKLYFMDLILHAFIGDLKKYNLQLDNYHNMLDYDKYSYRIVISILYSLKEDYHEAHRELVNLKNSFRNKAPKFDIRDILNYFLRYYYQLSHLDMDAKKLKAAQAKLQADVQEYNENTSVELSDFLPFIWLQHQLDKCLA